MMASSAQATPTDALCEPLALRAMRLAERAHRGSQRKAPVGEDRPDYFVHTTEVAWRLQQAGLDEQVVAAGFLHDVIEDCGYSQASLAQPIGSEEVAALVAWVSEPEKDHADWHARNSAYRQRMQRAPGEALALSCADKTANIGDMLRLLRRGYALSDFLSVGAVDQVAKFEALRALFATGVPSALLAAFDAALLALTEATAGERAATPSSPA